MRQFVYLVNYLLIIELMWFLCSSISGTLLMYHYIGLSLKVDAMHIILLIAAYIIRRAQKQNGLTHKRWFSPPNLEIYLKCVSRTIYFWKVWQFGRVQCIAFSFIYRSRLVGNFSGVLIFIIFMVDLIGSHKKFLPMKINVSTSTVIQISRLQSKKENFSVACEKDDNTIIP